jgi:L-fuculose-phosphate aldolase
MAVLRMPIPAVHYVISRLGTSEVPVIDYATYGTQQLAENAFAGLTGTTKALLLANHGALALGADLPEAALNARVLEILAAYYWRALAVGTPVILSDEEIGNVTRRHETYGQPQA